MLRRWRQLRDEWRGLRRFRALPREQRRLVFYSEGPGYWSHFAPVHAALVAAHGPEIAYVSSSAADPIVTSPPAGIVAFNVGEGAMRTLFFSTLDADVLLMTMPDLQTFHIKRSPHPVSYVYLHHSMVSTHMIYRPAAFDHFDAVLCVGPHHVAETRARERLASLPAKALVEHGYGRIDLILAEAPKGPRRRADGEPPRVLVAPSWGDNGLLERHGIDAVRPLLDAGLAVVLRPHPRTRKLRPDVIEQICRNYGEHPRFRLDEDTDGRDSLYGTDVMVSDWSGAALEFALGLERPVLFVDVPRKVLNPDYPALGIEPLEVAIRPQIGIVVAEEQLPRLGELAASAAGAAHDWQRAAQAARRQWLYNPGGSGVAAAEYLLKLLDQRRPE